MGVDPDVQVILNNLVEALEALEARLTKLEAGSPDGVVYKPPVTIEQTFDDGSSVVYRKD